MRVRPASVAQRKRTPASIGVATAASALLLAAASGPASGTATTTHATPGRSCAAAEKLPNRPLRVGVVLSAQPSNPFEGIVYRGLQHAVEELGIKGRAIVLGPKETGLASYSYLARQGFDLLVGSGFVSDLEAAALRFPTVCFLSIDGSIADFAHRPANLRGTVYRVEQGAYLAGYLAALVEQQQPRRHVISSIGGTKAPPVDRFIAGFQAGARKADPTITLLNGYTNDFERPASCRRLALHQIAEGSGVVFEVAGACGLGALQAAKEKHVWGIGVDADESFLGPHILTSVLKNLDIALLRAVKSLQNGTFHTDTDATLSLRNGGVGLGKISPRVPRPLILELRRIQRQLAHGQLTAPLASG